MEPAEVKDLTVEEVKEQEVAGSETEMGPSEEITKEAAEQWEKSLTPEQREELFKQFLEFSMKKARRRQDATKKKVTKAQRKKKRQTQKSSRRKNRK